MVFMIIPQYIHTSSVDQDTLSEIRSLSRESAAAINLIEDLQGQVNRLSLITQALWELLQSKVGLEESELTRLIEEIDLRDGVKDGRLKPKPKKCVECGRTVSIKTNLCLYCGYKVKQD